MRSGGYSGSSTTGVQKSAPTSNRSFWTWVSTAATSSSTLAGGQHHAEVGVGLVDVGVGPQPEVGLAGLAHVAQTRGAGVAGARVDARQVDHAPSLGCRPPGASDPPTVTRVTDVGSFRVVSEGPLTRPLSGTVHVGGAKNSALKLMAGALLAPGRSVIHNVPNILDVAVMGQLLRQLGCTVRDRLPGRRRPDVRADRGPSVDRGAGGADHKAPYELVRRLRASIAVLGPLVARCRRASVALPGGDAIGSRGLDMHILGLQELGAVVRIEHGQVVAEVPGGLRGANLWLDFPSVGATENLLMAAVMAKGPRSSTTWPGSRRSSTCARCSSPWAPASTASPPPPSSSRGSTGCTRSSTPPSPTGSSPARGSSRVPSPAATCTSAAAWPTTSTSCSTSSWPPARRSMWGRPGSPCSTHKRLGSFDVATLPYPGFPTDLQPFAMALASVSSGTAMITENVFEARFMFAQELARLGATCAQAREPLGEHEPRLEDVLGEHRGARRDRRREPSRTAAGAVGNPG